MGSEEMAGEAPALPPPAPVVIPRGTVLRVRLNSGLSTKSSAPGDRFTATLQDPVVVDGEVLVPKGAACGGHVTESSASGRMRGRAQLAVTLDSIEVRGRKHNIRTSSVARTSSGHAKRNAGFIGGGAGLGAVLGAIAGGGRGAAIGAAAGAGAGTAGAAATGKQNAALPAEALVTFSLRAPVSL